MSNTQADSGIQGRAGEPILLVEDYEDLADMVQMLLETQGYVVKVASNIAGAVEVFEKASISLVLSDLTLPDGSGLDLLDRLRAHGRVRAIAISGYDSREFGCRCRQAGFDEYLAKPFEEQQLMDAVRRVLGPSSPARCQ